MIVRIRKTRQPAVTARVVTIKSAKTREAEERHARLVESGPTIPRNYGPKGAAVLSGPHIARWVSARLLAIGSTATAAYRPAEDSSVDDEVEVTLPDGQLLSLQLGAGYLGVNRYEGEGDDFAAVTLYFGASYDRAVDRLIRAVREHK